MTTETGATGAGATGAGTTGMEATGAGATGMGRAVMAPSNALSSSSRLRSPAVAAGLAGSTAATGGTGAVMA
ncbi:MAG: hypothetical protein EOS36_16530 [Mesorhizobium sp.]|nr:MAG: hypothetical protein EOS36_16530 [Mesorhizobium sp.]